MQNLIYYFRAIARGFLFWRGGAPIENVAELAEFVGARAVFIAQTTLYGYLRTRSGLQHFNLFTDKVFTKMLRPARTRLILVCLDDLAIFAAASVGRAENASRENMQKLAVALFDQAIAQIDLKDIPTDEVREASRDFAARATLVDWEKRGGEAAFEKSPRALIELAPVIDLLKKLDDEIVKNSMRFKWRGVRAELVQRVRPDSVLADLTATREI